MSMALLNTPASGDDAVEAVKHYIQRGWQLAFFQHGTKGPNELAWNTPRELVTTEARALAKLSGGPINFGVCHQPSGTCSLDIDDEAWTRYIFDELGLDYDAIMGAGLRVRSKNNRDKAIFRAPSDLALHKINWPKQAQQKPNDVFTVFELRAGPNQDVLPPSKHPDGHHYAWVEGAAPWDFDEIPMIPEQLEMFWRNFNDFKDEIKALCPWKAPWETPSRPKQAQRTVSSKHGDIIGKFNKAMAITDLLAECGYKKRGKRWLAPSSNTGIPGVVIFDNDKCYSHHGSDLLADGHSHDAFDVMTILQYGGNFDEALNEAARIVGVERGAEFPEHHDVQIDYAALIKSAVKEAIVEERESVAVRQEKQEKVTITTQLDVEPLPDRFLTPPGILGDVVKFSLESAQKPQPVLALGGALSLVATVLGRKVATETGLRTNMLLLGVAGTSAGKEHARKINKAILQTAGLSEFLGGEELASGQGLMARMAVSPNSLFQLDEFGLLMQAVSNQKSGAWMVAIMTNLMKLFSSAGTIVHGTEKADHKHNPRADIEYPCCNVYATTTPETLFPALGASHVTSGYLNRLLVMFVPPGRVKRQHRSIGQPPQEIIDWIHAVRAFTIGMAGTTPGNPVTVTMDDDAHDLFDEWEDELDTMMESMSNSELAPMWGRAWEHAAKVALLIACSKQSADQFKANVAPVIDKDSAVWGIDFVRFTIGTMEKQVAARMAESDFHRLILAVTDVIQKAGPKGRTESEISNFCRPFRAQNPTVRDHILSVIKRDKVAELVISPSASGRGRPRQAWVWCELLETQSDDAVSAYNPHG